MAKFIELHTVYGHIRKLINVDSIAFVDEVGNGTASRVCLNCHFISSHEKGGTIRVEGRLEHIEVEESYSKVKSLIEE